MSLLEEVSREEGFVEIVGLVCVHLLLQPGSEGLTSLAYVERSAVPHAIL